MKGKYVAYNNKFKLYLIGMGVVLLPLFSLPASSDSTTDLSKADWLEQVRMAASVPICKSFVEDESIAAQMKVRQISYEHCVSLIPDIAQKCEKKYDASLPATINDDSAEKWGRVIGECIGHEFAMSYLYPPDTLPDTLPHAP